jgi:hypothetical protein
MHSPCDKPVNKYIFSVYDAAQNRAHVVVKTVFNESELHTSNEFKKGAVHTNQSFYSRLALQFSHPVNREYVSVIDSLYRAYYYYYNSNYIKGRSYIS